MLNRIAQFIKQQAMIPRGCTVLVGVSGGMDSVVLLRVLWLLRDRLGIKLEAAHFNHGIRTESVEEERFVSSLCGSLGVSLHIGRADVPAMARDRAVSLEVAAREARHGFFWHVMGERGIGLLALAHHRDDQAETVLLRLIRGAGADGLAAMAPVEGTGIVRPLLCVGRAEIRSWCEQNGVDWREDASNADTSIPRNWVRHELLPMMEARLNPAVTDALCRTAELLREDGRYLDGLAREALRGMVALPGGGVAIPVDDVKGLPQAVQSRALRLLARQAGLAADVEWANIQDIAALLQLGKTGRRVDLDGGAVALREAHSLMIVPWLEPPAAWEPAALAVPGETAACGGVFRCELLHGILPEYREHPKWVQFVDAEAFPDDVWARSRKEGDRFHPLGAPGGRKLKEYLIDRKVSRFDRDALPLLAHGADVLWVVGHGIADDIKINAATRTVLKISFQQKENGV